MTILLLCTSRIKAALKGFILGAAIVWTSAPAADAPKRLALVIGNGQYQFLPKLNNPENDAQLLAASLRDLGFITTQLNNLSLSSLTEAIRTFANNIHAGDVGLFYYAGHAVQVNGQNYLLPVDVDIRSEEDLATRSFVADDLMSKLASIRNATNILVFDACRDNPYSIKRRSKKSDRQQTNSGLAPMDAPKGTLIAFSTAPGKSAMDGKGKHSIYSEQLAMQIRTPGLQIEEVFKRVRVAVTSKTADQQIPWETTSLIGNLTFVPL
jgi:uncharacterized caspase-like protein